MLYISRAALRKPQGSEGRSEQTPPRKESLSGVVYSDKLLEGGWTGLFLILYFSTCTCFFLHHRLTPELSHFCLLYHAHFLFLCEHLFLLTLFLRPQHLLLSSHSVSLGGRGNAVGMDQGVLTCQLFIILPWQMTNFTHCSYSLGVPCRSSLLHPICLDWPASCSYSRLFSLTWGSRWQRGIRFKCV